MNTLRSIWPLLLAGLMLQPGCQRVSRSTSSTTVGGRQINTRIDGQTTMSTARRAEGGGASEISFAGGKLVIEKDKVMLNGAEIAKLPAATTKIDIEYLADVLTISADGNKVYSGKLPK
jgi:hypothetical protein